MDTGSKANQETKPMNTYVRVETNKTMPKVPAG